MSHEINRNNDNNQIVQISNRCRRDDANKKSNYTALGIACALGYMDMIKYLVEDCYNCIEETCSDFGNTPLSEACQHGHYDIVRYFLELGADIEATRAACPRPLWYAASNGDIHLVDLLIRHGASLAPSIQAYSSELFVAYANAHFHSVRKFFDWAASSWPKLSSISNFGLTPLLAAAVHGHIHIVEYLVSVPDLVNQHDKIDAMELLAVTLIKMNAINKGIHIWKLALQQRYSDGNLVIGKPTRVPVRAYNFAQEIADPEELVHLRTDPLEMRIQALLIFERILGPFHHETHDFFLQVGTFCIYCGKMERCFDLWDYVLDIYLTVFPPLNYRVIGIILAMIDLFGRIENNDDEKYSKIMKVFEKAIYEVRRAKILFEQRKHFNVHYRHKQLDFMMVVTLHIAWLLTEKMPEYGSDNYNKLKLAMTEFIKVKATSSRCLDMFIRGISGDPNDHFDDHFYEIDENDMNKRYETTSPELLDLFIDSGADINIRDKRGNTVLHLLAMYQPERPDLILPLLEAGVHWDVANKRRVVLKTLVAQHNTFDLKCFFNYSTLQCLAAKVLREMEIDISKLPKVLQIFGCRKPETRDISVIRVVALDEESNKEGAKEQSHARMKEITDCAVNCRNITSVQF